jgi:hypothetical protein
MTDEQRYAVYWKGMLKKAIQIDSIVVNNKVGKKTRYRVVHEISNEKEFRVVPLTKWFDTYEEAKEARDKD